MPRKQAAQSQRQQQQQTQLPDVKEITWLMKTVERMSLELEQLRSDGHATRSHFGTLETAAEQTAHELSSLSARVATLEADKEAASAHEEESATVTAERSTQEQAAVDARQGAAAADDTADGARGALPRSTTTCFFIGEPGAKWSDHLAEDGQTLQELYEDGFAVFCQDNSAAGSASSLQSMATAQAAENFKTECESSCGAQADATASSAHDGSEEEPHGGAHFRQNEIEEESVFLASSAGHQCVEEVAFGERHVSVQEEGDDDDADADEDDTTALLQMAFHDLRDGDVEGALAMLSAATGVPTKLRSEQRNGQWYSEISPDGTRVSASRPSRAASRRAAQVAAADRLITVAHAL